MSSFSESLNENRAAPPAGERFEITVGDGSLAGWRWLRPGAPRLLFCHANGFCASAYKAMIAHLAGRAEIWALDLRGHGRSRAPADPDGLRNWRIFGRDIAAVLDEARRMEEPGDKRPWFVAGHSLGAVAAAFAARGRSDVAGLMLIEPVAVPPASAWFMSTSPGRFALRRSPLVRGALTRRAEWPSRAAVRESYARKALFKPWRDGALDDYLEDGFADVQGGVRLACDPRWEAATFGSQSPGFWRAVAEAPAPVWVLGAERRTSTLFAGAAARFRRLGARVEIARGVGHLIPMEDPAAAAAFIADGLASVYKP